MKTITTAEVISVFLNSSLSGNNIKIDRAASAKDAIAGSVCYIKSGKYSGSVNTKALYIVENDYSFPQEDTYNFIRVFDSRLSFAKVLSEFFVPSITPAISDTAKLGTSIQIGDKVNIGEYCIIGDNVIIGDNTTIAHHVVIEANSSIGNNCIIKSSAIIGEAGFGFAFDKNKMPVRIPHIGKVVIGNNVEIGAGTTVCRGTINNTIIDYNVKIDDHVHIAHNVHIGEGSVITACAEFSGSVKVGKHVWVGPNCSIIQDIEISDGAFIGIGAMVHKDVPENYACISGMKKHVKKSFFKNLPM